MSWGVAMSDLKVRAIVQDEVRAFACEGRHQMRRIAEEGQAGRTLPAMADRQRMDRTKDGIGFALCDEGGEVRCPPFELFCDMGQARSRIAEVQGVEPVFRLVQGHVGVQRVVGMAVRQNSFARSNAMSVTLPIASALDLWRIPPSRRDVSMNEMPV